MNPTFSGLLALFLFSFGTVLVALTGNIPPLQLTFITLCTSSSILAVVLYKMGYRCFDALREPLGHYATAFVGVGGYVVLLNTAFKNAPAFEVNMLNYLWPVLLVGFVKLFQRKNLRLSEIAGLFSGFVGVCFVFWPSGGSFFDAIAIGHYLAFAAALIWALYSAFISGKNYSISILVPVMFLTGLICLSGHLLFEEASWTQPYTVWFAVGLLITTSFGYALWDYAMQKGDQVLLGSLSFVVPLLSTSYFILFGLTPSRIEVAVGGGFILLGCVCVNFTHVLGLWQRLRVKKNETL